MDPARSGAAPASWLTTPVASETPDAIARRWAGLLVAGRAAALGMALALLALDGFGPRDRLLAIAGTAYAVASTALLVRVPSLRRLPAAWAVDAAAGLALIFASGDWRSPFYLLWLTALAVPAVRIPPRRAGGLGAGAVAAFLVVAFVGGPKPGTLDPTSSETFAVHLALPVLLAWGLSYAADVLRRLDLERARSAELSLQAERRRIAWELHDSAKQRVHAAHLLLTSLRGGAGRDPRIEQAVVELESAGAEMDTTLAGLRSPLSGRRLHEALADRAAELRVAGGPRIEVEGAVGQLPEPLATHAYRIGVEAMTNAVRHSGAAHVELHVRAEDRRLLLDVRDDGVGPPADRRRDGTGLQAMHSRAASLGGRLRVGPRPDGDGTHVQLEIPRSEGAPQ